ncbi:YbaK/EbsC family protein [Candidatus Bathyarchaeota archaeon]|nr:YbaK/EbsC family protein [Candidatus Bathyarchaeota archaeon]
MAHPSLSSFLQSKGVKFKILTFKGSTITVDDAVKQLSVPKERIIKSVLFVDEKGMPVLAIVTGDCRVDEERLAKVCGVDRVRKARPKAVKSITGYEVGALPPLGHKKPIRTFIDPKVMRYETVFGGGGDINKLLEIDPRDLKRLTNATVTAISVK